MARICQVAAALLAGSGTLLAQTSLCAPCHREIANAYARTGMARSFFKPGSANTIEDYGKAPEYDHALSDSHYAMTIRNGEYFERRWQLDGNGKEINGEELKID